MHAPADRTGRIHAAAAAALALFCIWGCADRGPAVRQAVAMNTYVSVSVYDRDIPRALVEARLDSAVAVIRHVEAMASDYSDSSDLGRVNTAAGRAAVRVPSELSNLLRRAIAFGAERGGAFNVTVGPLVKTWDFLGEHPRVPPRRVIDSLLPLVDLAAVAIHDDSVFLRKRGMALDLGGIGKGYAADLAASVLRRGGIRHAVVDIGGNLAVIWDTPGEQYPPSVTVEVLHPRRDGMIFGSFPAGTCGVSTSGDYQRCFFEGGVRYHHILDPATGYPARGVAAVTVVAADAMTADVLSTLVFVLGREAGMAFLRNSPGVEGLMIVEEGDSLRPIATDGMGRIFRPEPAL